MVVVLPDTGEVVGELLSKLEAARWLRMWESAAASVIWPSWQVRLSMMGHFGTWWMSPPSGSPDVEVHRFHIDELRRFVGGGGEVVASVPRIGPY